MDVKEAVRKAKAWVADTYADEQISHIGLEEVTFDEARAEWRVTIGFSRSWNPIPLRNPLALSRDPSGQRNYKVVEIRDKDGEVVGMKDRILETP